MEPQEVMTRENLRSIVRDLALGIRSVSSTYEAHKHWDACIETILQFIDLQLPEQIPDHNLDQFNGLFEVKGIETDA